jgi:hypothetical protein
MSNFIGHTVYGVAALPSANTATAMESLTFVQIKGELTLPQLAVSHSTIDVPNLNGFTTVEKAAATGVATTATFKKIAADAGQIDITDQAAESGGVWTFKLVDGSGTDGAPISGDPVIYCQGIVHSFLPNQGDNATIEGFTVSFNPNAAPIAATEPT